MIIKNDMNPPEITVHTFIVLQPILFSYLQDHLVKKGTSYPSLPLYG